MDIEKYKIELESAIYEGADGEMFIGGKMVEKVLNDYHKEQLNLSSCTIHDVNTYAKLRKALETIRDAYYTNGETDKEKVNDLKAIAFNVLYEIDNN